MSKNKSKRTRTHIAKAASKAERIGIEIPAEVRKELRMEKTKGFGRW